MDFSMEAIIFLAYAAGLMFVYFFGRILLVPMKLLFKLLISSFLGGLAVVVINIIGGFIGLIMPINLVTAAVTGVLGFPGVICLLLYFNL